MNNEMLVSICVPVFNHAKYIEQTIRSALAQSYPYVEVVVSDNASTDETKAVIKQVADARLKARFNSYNVGFAGNLQLASQTATGDVIGILSSDDLIEPNAIELYMEAIQWCRQNGLLGEKNLFVITAQAANIDSEGHRLPGFRGSRGTYEKYKKEANACVLATHTGKFPIEIYDAKKLLGYLVKSFQTGGAFCPTFYSRELWESVEGYFVLRQILPDRAFMWKMLSKLPLYIHIPLSLFRYRIHEGQQGKTRDKFWINTWQLDELVSLQDTLDEILDLAGMDRMEFRRRYAKRVISKFWPRLANGDYYGAACALSFAQIADPELQNRSSYKLKAITIFFGKIGLLMAKIVRRANLLKR